MEDSSVSEQRRFKEVCEKVEFTFTQEDGDETKMNTKVSSHMSPDRCCTCPLSHWRPGNETDPKTPMTYFEVQNKMFKVEPLNRCDFNKATNTSGNFETDVRFLSTFEVSSLSQNTSKMNATVTIALSPQATKGETPSGWKYLIIPSLEGDETSPKPPTQNDNIPTPPATCPSAEKVKAYTPTGWNYIIIPSLEGDKTPPKPPTQNANIPTPPATCPSAEKVKAYTPTGWNYIIIPALRM